MGGVLMGDVYAVPGDVLRGIADAIKEKTGDPAPMKVEDMELKIRLINDKSTSP